MDDSYLINNFCHDITELGGLYRGSLMRQWVEEVMHAEGSSQNIFHCFPIVTYLWLVSLCLQLSRRANQPQTSYSTLMPARPSQWQWLLVTCKYCITSRHKSQIKYKWSTVFPLWFHHTPIFLFLFLLSYTFFSPPPLPFPPFQPFPMVPMLPIYLRDLVFLVKHS